MAITENDLPWQYTPFPTRWKVSTGGAVGGAFTLTFRGASTASIPFNATAAEVKSALVNLVDNYTSDDWQVVGLAGGPWTVSTPPGSLAAGADALTGGTLLLTADMPTVAANFNGLASFAAKTAEDWEQDLREREIARWGEEGVLGGLFDGLAKGKSFVAALMEALINEIFGSDGVFGTVEEARLEARAKFAEKWENILTAQGTASAARRLARLRARSGNNFVSDSKALTAEAWTQEGVEQSDVEARSGTHSVAVARAAADRYLWFNTSDDGTVEPILTDDTQSYFLQCWVFDGGTQAYGSANLVAKAINSKTGAATESTVDSITFSAGTRGSWRKLSGYYTMPAYGYDSLSIGVKLPGNALIVNDVVFVDDMLCREATDHQVSWNRFWDGLSGTSGSTGKGPGDVESAAGIVRGWSLSSYRLSRARIRAGTNLVSDPSIENPEFWTQPSTAQVDANIVLPNEGNYTLRVTSQGSTPVDVFFNTDAEGEVDPISARAGDHFLVEAYVYSPSANATGTVQLIARQRNARTGATSDVVVASKTLSSSYRGSWQKLSGYVKVTAGYNQISVGLRLAENLTTSGNPFYLDSLLCREVTAAQRMIDGLFDGLGGSTGSFGKDPDEVTTLAGLIRTWASGGYRFSRARIRGGTNLITDPNFDDALFWTQTSTALVDSSVITPRTGDLSLQVTSRGATATEVFFNTSVDGAVDPIKARLGELYYLEVYCYSPAANANATVQLVARLRNSRTHATADVVVDTQAFTTLTEGQWEKLAGYVKIPAGYNQISAGIILPSGQSTTGNVIFVDDALCRETTAAQRMIDALFDGFNGSTGSFGMDPDDVYGVMGGVQDGTRALRLARQRAKIGPNFVNDPRIEDSSFWAQTGSTRSETYSRDGGSSLEVTRGAAATYAWFNTLEDGTVQPIVTWQDDALYVQCWYYAPSQTGGGSISLVVRAINSTTDAYTETALRTVSAIAEGGVWKKLSGTFIMPEGADSFSAGVKVDATGSTNYKVYVDSLRIREATAFQRLSNVSKLRTRAGNNLVTDPNFDDLEFWTQDSVAQVDSTVVTPRTGTYSLQVTSRGATATTAFFNTSLDGTVEPIKTRLNELFYAECYVYSPAANSNGTVKLIARLANAKTGNSTDVTIATQSFTSLNEGQWLKLSGYVKTTAGYNLLSAGILLDANQTVSNNVFLVDDALIREVTAAQRTIDVLFDGFNATTGSFGKDADDVGGSMGFLGDGPKGLKLARARAKVGANFVNDPRIEDVGYWQQAGSARSDLYRRGGPYSLQVTASVSGTYVWWNTIDGGSVEPISTWLDDALFMQCFYFAPAQTGTATMQLVVKAINSYTGAETETVVKSITVDESGSLFKKFNGVYTMPDGADSFSAGIKLISTNTSFKVWLDSLLIREATGVQRIIDGLVQGTDGSTATGADYDEPKKAVRRGWAALFDGLSGNNVGTNTDKTPLQAAAAAATVNTTATTAKTQVINKMMGGSSLVTNPDFEDTTQALPLGAWSTYSTEQARSGSRSVKVVATNTGNCPVPLFTDQTDYLKFKCTPGEVYSYETWVYGKSTNTQVPSRTYSLLLNQGYTATLTQTYTVTLTQVSQLQFAGTVTGGTYTLSYNGLTTAAIQWNDSAATVQTRLQAIIPSATVNASYVVSLPGNATLTANSAGLTGGGTMTVTYGTYRYSINGQTSASIAFNTATSVVQSTIQAMVSNGTVTVTGGGTAALTVTVTGLNSTVLTSSVVSLGSVTVSPSTGGTFTLTYGGQTTSTQNIVGNTASAIQTALRALSAVGSTGATVTVVSGGFTVVITGINSTLTATGSGVALAGSSYTLSYAGKTTTSNAWTTSAATIKSRLEALTTIGSGQTTVTAITSGSVTTGYTIVINGKAGALTSTVSTTVGSAAVTQTATSSDGYITFGTLGFNAAGTAVTVPDAGSLPATTALNGKWTKFATYWTVPDGVYSFCPIITVNQQVAANETYYFDQPAVREVTVAAQALNQSNLVLSGDFEDSTVTRHTDNAALVGAYSSEQEYAGSQSYKLTTQAGGDCGVWLVPHAKPVSTTVPGTGVAIQENQIYYFEIWYFLPTANKGNPDSVKLTATVTDGGATSAVVTIAEMSAPVKNSWQQLSGSYTVPAGYKFMWPQFTIGSNATSGDSVFIDKAIIRDETNQATWKTLADTFLGGISTDGTLTDATGAVKTIYNTVVAAAGTAADLKTERTAAASAGRNYSVDFSKYPERLMAGAASGAFPTYPANTDADFTLTYSGAGSGSLSILEGQAHWNPGSGVRSVFAKYRDETLTDYQQLSGTLTTPMRAGGGQNWIIGRCNASNNTFVYAYGYANSLVSYQAELGCYVNGTKYVFATAAAPPNFNLSMRVGVGSGSGVRRYQVLSGSKVIIDYQDTGLVSRLCDANHTLPANHTATCVKYRGWGFQSAADGGAVPGDATLVTCADADPTAVVGSGAKISRDLTTNVSASNGRNVFPEGFFNVVDEVSSDLTVEKNVSNLPTGKIAVSLSGWYLVEIGFRVNPTVWSTWNIAPALYKNGTATSNVFKVGHDGTSSAQGIRYAHSSFIAYLNEGDWIRPGYDADKAISNVFTGSSTAESYMSITLLNRSYD